MEQKFEKNWCYKINEPGHPHNGETLYSGRYTAVTGVVFVTLPNKETYVLANRRGSGTPDFQGLWNCPCGFLEANESGVQGVARETFEETGFKVIPEDFFLVDVETEPELCNKGHVTIRYAQFLNKNALPKLEYKNINGEVDEVESVKWINLKEVDNYDWAFNHKELINKIENFLNVI